MNDLRISILAFTLDHFKSDHSHNHHKIYGITSIPCIITLMEGILILYNMYNNNDQISLLLKKNNYIRVHKQITQQPDSYEQVTMITD